MYEVSVRVKHNCPYSRIANLFDIAIYEVCSDLYDLLIIPERISEKKLQQIADEIREPESLEFYQPDYNQNLSYIYFNCMITKVTFQSAFTTEQSRTCSLMINQFPVLCISKAG